MLHLSSAPADRHTTLEDIQGIFVGATLVALAVQFFRASDLFTGQIAGLALISSYTLPYTFGSLFFLMNLPFYVLAIKQLGWRFTLKSLAAVSLMSAIADGLPFMLTLTINHPGLGAVTAGILAGVGLVTLFRHGATLGGVGIVALWLQDTRGIKAGNVQLGFDVLVFAFALLLFPWQIVAWSFLSAVILNLIMTINHRRDRYIARS